MTKLWMGCAVLLLAIACTQTPSPQPPAPPPPPPPDANAIVRLEVSPAALLMTTETEKRQLTVRALNAAGQDVNAAITWTSSRPEQVSVSGSGELEARVGLGASQIVARVGDVKSAPVLVSVAQPAAGVTLLQDAQVRG
ncbi:MAG: hypothetical protein HC933_14645 [Pleurocapsa sp. SU_196_0]|nr:hypothetical protein [Pleurocapsa sp. SU_196_0]